MSIRPGNQLKKTVQAGFHIPPYQIYDRDCNQRSVRRNDEGPHHDDTCWNTPSHDVDGSWSHDDDGYAGRNDVDDDHGEHDDSAHDWCDDDDDGDDL